PRGAQSSGGQTVEAAWRPALLGMDRQGSLYQRVVPRCAGGKYGRKSGGQTSFHSRRTSSRFGWPISSSSYRTWATGLFTFRILPRSTGVPLTTTSQGTALIVSSSSLICFAPYPIAERTFPRRGDCLNVALIGTTSHS